MALGWLWWRVWVPGDAVDAAALCVAGVALGDIDFHFAWQASGESDITGLFSRMCVGHCLQLCSSIWQMDLFKSCMSGFSRQCVGHCLQLCHYVQRLRIVEVMHFVLQLLGHFCCSHFYRCAVPVLFDPGRDIVT